MDTFLKTAAKAIGNVANTFVIRPAKWIHNKLDQLANCGACLLVLALENPRSMLDTAVTLHAPLMVRLAVKCGAQFRNETYPYNDIMDTALWRRDWEMMRLLVELGADPNPPLGRQKTSNLGSDDIALIAALTHPEAPHDLAQFLVDHGAQVNDIPVMGTHSIIEYAVKIDNSNMVSFLGKNGANPHVHSGETENLLSEAVSRRKFACAMALMDDAGMSPNDNPGSWFIRQYKHKHIILEACNTLHPQAHTFVEKALKHGASATVRNRAGETPLHIATKNQNDFVCQILLNAEGSHLVSQRDNKGKTPLEIALEDNWIKGAEIMLEQKPSMSRRIYRKPLSPENIALIKTYIPKWKHLSDQ